MHDQVLKECPDAGEHGCIQHGTHFGVSQVGVDPSEVSDGYHTFGDLYEHRRALTAALCKSLPLGAWRSKEHHPEDDPIFSGGYFIVGISLPQGTITYHYKLKHWDDFHGVIELDHAPKWDGAQPEDSVTRLLAWARAER